MELKTDRKLLEAMDRAKARVEAMTPMELEVMLAAQRASYVRAEMNWPKPRFRYDEHGAKVYESYEDYCNG